MEKMAQNSPVRPRKTLRPLPQSGGGVPKGSLLISDVFSSSESHGVEVAKAAWSAGFQGEIYYQQAMPEPVPELQKAFQATALLSEQSLTTEEVASLLHDVAVGPPLHMLISAKDEVRRAGQSEAQNSALNLSSGTCKAQVTSQITRMATSSQTAVENLSQLFNLDPSKLTSKDPEEAAREHHRLQQHLVRTVDTAWKQDPRLEQHRREFAEEVRSFESRHNSVVIAAGNEGLVEPILEQASGYDLTVPDDFTENILECPEVTAVGATIILDGQEAPARYSSAFPGVDVYASGDVVLGQEFDDSQGLGKAGSSLAAPRIAAVMAKLHGQNDRATSDQVQQRLESDFAHGPVPILDTPRAITFLQA